MSNHTFILIDGHAVIYRAYFAFTDLSTSSGQLVNAVYGFSRILLTVIKDFEPEYIAVTFDHPQTTKRAEEYAEYKANRESMPDDLRPQIQIIKDIVTAFNIPQFEMAGVEADDLIGTLSRQACEQTAQQKSPMQTVIVTGDRDAFQLVTDCIHVYMPGRSKPVRTPDMEYDPKGVEQKMGVKPSQIVDLKALMGDASDNIPGVDGIGAKGAAKLIQEFGSLDALYEAVEHQAVSELEHGEKPTLTKSLINKLIAGKASAYLSQKLATIDQHVPIELDLQACATSGYKKEDVIKIFEQYEFDSLIKLLPADEFELDVQAALF
jgi:DNA polymerase-1